MLYLLENGNQETTIMVTSKDEDISGMDLLNKIGLTIRGAKWRNVTKDCIFYLPTEGKRYRVENSTPFDDVAASGEKCFWIWLVRLLLIFILIIFTVDIID